MSLTECPSSTGGDASPTTSTAAPTGSPSSGPTSKPSPTSTGGDTRAELDEEGTAYAEAIASLEPAGMDEEQGACLAVEWVSAIGVPAFVEAGITPDELRSEEQSLADVSIGGTVADDMVDGFATCGIDAKALIVDEAAGRQVRNEAIADCVDEKLTPEAAREAWIGALTGQDTSAIEAIVAGCTPPGPPKVTGLIGPDG